MAEQKTDRVSWSTIPAAFLHQQSSCNTKTVNRWHVLSTGVTIISTVAIIHDSHLLLHLTQSNRSVFKEMNIRFLHNGLAWPTDRQTDRVIIHTFQCLYVLSRVQLTAATEYMITFNASYFSFYFFLRWVSEQVRRVSAQPRRALMALCIHQLHVKNLLPQHVLREVLTSDFQGFVLPTAPFPTGYSSHGGWINVSL